MSASLRPTAVQDPGSGGEAPIAPLAPAAWHALLATSTLALGAGIGLYQLGRSNRPHELTAAPYVAVLLAASVVLAVLGLRRLVLAWRKRGQRRLRSLHGVLAFLLALVGATSALLFLAAAGTALQILLG